jgi:hypothetical protein
MEPTPLPMACSLGPEDASSRAAEWRRLYRQALIEGRREGDAVALRFHASPDVERALDDLVAAERDCCPFLNLALSPEGDDLLLTVSGPPQARPIVEQFLV